MQSVHNPYDVPPIDVNTTYPTIVNYQRRIYAGMVAELDTAVANVTAAFEAAGLWNDTVLVFTADVSFAFCAHVAPPARVSFAHTGCLLLLGTRTAVSGLGPTTLYVVPRS